VSAPATPQPQNLYGSAFAHALKDACIAAVVAFGLFVLMLGFLLDDSTGPFKLTPRPELLAKAVGLVFAGRFLVALGYRLYLARRVSHSASSTTLFTQEKFAAATPYFGAALLIFALLVPVMFYTRSYYLGIAITVLIYVMLGWGLNIVVGLAGLLDLGYVAFYAVGAYSYAIIAKELGWSFWVCLPLAGVFAAFFGIILGFPVLRLRGDYLAIVTLAFGEIIRIVIINWISVTGGPNGINTIPRASFFGIPFNTDDNGFAATFGLEFDPAHRTVFLFYIILALALLTNWTAMRLRRLPIGRAWEALREDEIACRALGVNTTNTKLTAFAIGAMFGGFAGSFFAVRQGGISPESFTFGESALILAIVVLGGMGSQIGIVLAAIALVVSLELFREFEQFRLVLFGFGMVAIMVWRPRGLISHRDPTVYLREKKSISGAHVSEGHG